MHHICSKTRTWRRTILLAMLAAAFFTVATVSAGGSYIYNDGASAVPDRAIFKASLCITGKQAGADYFSLPEDIFVYGDKVYVADTGNARVVILDENLKFISDITTLHSGEDTKTFLTPTGIFVSEAGILVCDRDDKQAALIDHEGNILQIYDKPENKTLENFIYKPVKAVMDEFNNVYILSSGIYQGFLQFTLDGKFMGFFGSNQVETTLTVAISRFWKRLFNKEAAETMARDIPMEYSNACIDDKGFIYASIYQTYNRSFNLKKLNSWGRNILGNYQDGNALDRNRYGDQQSFVFKGIEWSPTLVDVTVDDNGIVSVLDGTWCRVFQYNKDGDMLGVFGGIGETAGCFSTPVAIDHMGDRYLVLDKLKGSITVFEPTKYQKLLCGALLYYDRGEYQESVSLWQSVLKYNGKISLAYKSIGKAYMQQSKLEEALNYLKKAGDREGYSIVLGQLRQKFIQDNFVWILFCLIAFAIGIKYLARGARRWMGFELKCSYMNRNRKTEGGND